LSLKNSSVNSSLSKENKIFKSTQKSKSLKSVDKSHKKQSSKLSEQLINHSSALFTSNTNQAESPGLSSTDPASLNEYPLPNKMYGKSNVSGEDIESFYSAITMLHDAAVKPNVSEESQGQTQGENPSAMFVSLIKNDHDYTSLDTKRIMMNASNESQQNHGRSSKKLKKKKKKNYPSKDEKSDQKGKGNSNNQLQYSLLSDYDSEHSQNTYSQNSKDEGTEESDWDIVRATKLIQPIKNSESENETNEIDSSEQEDYDEDETNTSSSEINEDSSSDQFEDKDEKESESEDEFDEEYKTESNKQNRKQMAQANKKQSTSTLKLNNIGKSMNSSAKTVSKRIVKSKLKQQKKKLSFVRDQKRRAVELNAQKQTQRREKMEQEKLLDKPPMQCLGPGCVQQALTNSKYCSYECGMKLAKERLFFYLKSRIEQYNASPSYSNQLNLNELNRINAEIEQLRGKLSDLEKKHLELDKIIERAKFEKVNPNVEVSSFVSKKKLSINLYYKIH
jgi:hypothetical protein